MGELPGIAYDPSSPIRCLLIASACLLGGPRRRLGRLKVHGMSRAAHDLHGGPLSSHYRATQLALCERCWSGWPTRLHLAHTAAVARFAQSCFCVRVRHNSIVYLSWSRLVRPLLLAVKMLWLWGVLTFLCLSLWSILDVQRVWVASGNGLIKLILVLVGGLVALRREIWLGRRLRCHLEDRDSCFLDIGASRRAG